MYIYVLTALHTSQEQQRVRGRFCCSYSLGCRGSQKNLPKARFKQSHSKGSLLFLTTRPPVAIASRVFSDPLQHYQAVAITLLVFLTRFCTTRLSPSHITSLVFSAPVL